MLREIKRVELDQSSVSVAERLAQKRHDTFAHDSYESTAFGKSSYDVHLLGAKAEVAVANRYGLLPDMKERLTGDQHDFEAVFAGDLVTIDVKSATYKPAKLLVRETKTQSDYYLNTFISNPDATTVELIGWASRQTLLDGEHKPSPAGSHMNYVLWPDEMDAVPHRGKLEREV